MATKAVMATEVVPTAMKATATTVTAAMATSGRGSSESGGRSERDKDESKFTKHFDLHVCGAGCTVSMVRSYAADTGGAVREITQTI